MIQAGNPGKIMFGQKERRKGLKERVAYGNCIVKGKIKYL